MKLLLRADSNDAWGFFDLGMSFRLQVWKRGGCPQDSVRARSRSRVHQCSTKKTKRSFEEIWK